MSEVCAVCQESTDEWKDVLNEKIGTPKIEIKELIDQCLGNTLEIGADLATVLCITCEWKLLEYYEATLLVEEKKCAFKLLVKPAKQTVSTNCERSTRKKPCSSSGSDFIKSELSWNDAESEWGWDDSQSDGDWDKEWKPVVAKKPKEKTKRKYVDVEIESDNAKRHSPKLDRYCKECEVECPTDEVFKLHIQKVHATNSTAAAAVLEKIICSECQMEQPTDAVYKEHLKAVHKITNTFKCNVCDQLYNTNTLLTAHLSSAHFPLTCLICGRSYTHKRGLRAHMEVHSDKNYQCDECGKRYPHKESLIKHKMVHSDTRNFQCDECEKRFRNTSHLKRHKLTHSGLKPHVCPICNKGFGQKYNMTAHMREHDKTGGAMNQISCKTCSLQFANVELLNLHMVNSACLSVAAPSIQTELYNNQCNTFS